MKLIITLLTLFTASALTFGQNQTKTLISSDFENNPTFIKMDNPSNNFWQIGKPNKLFFKNAHSGSRVIVTDSIHPYSTNSNSAFEFSFKITEWDASFTNLSFWHYYNIAPSDSAKIEVSYDGGKNWNNIVKDTNYLIWPSSTLPIITGTSANWEFLQFRWTWCIGSKLSHNSSYKMCNPPDSVIVRFNFFSGNNNTNQDGWMIDDIIVTETDGIGEVEKSNPFENYVNVYPNPSNDIVTIFCDAINNHVTIIKVLNSQGKDIYNSIIEEASNKFSIDLTGKEKGIYFIQLIDEKEKVLTQKIVLE
jgi:hypothetical protein